MARVFLSIPSLSTSDSTFVAVLDGELFVEDWIEDGWLSFMIISEVLDDLSSTIDEDNLSRLLLILDRISILDSSGTFVKVFWNCICSIRISNFSIRFRLEDSIVSNRTLWKDFQKIKIIFMEEKWG